MAVGNLECQELASRRFQMWEAAHADSLRDAEAGGDGDWIEERDIFLGVERMGGAAIVMPKFGSTLPTIWPPALPCSKSAARHARSFSSLARRGPLLDAPMMQARLEEAAVLDAEVVDRVSAAGAAVRLSRAG